MKERFLSKWSNWWSLTRDAKQLNMAFAKELDELIEHEVKSRQQAVSGSFKHSILDTWKFSEWVAYNYVRLHEVWVHKHADQRNKDNWKNTGELWALWWENFR
jgi:hypothetical protein